ncbi:unnamed protein product [Staurois parvus]|uniref:RING-type domain-containing protein n=1 Tax=Staurois parvus TaxID=386267 RepID=A0ABN9F3M1_9NEOB|nr:unnamed protein product [Staurois parvus]
MLDNWKRGDSAFDKHKRLYPSCSFIQNASPVNLGASLYSAFSPPSSLSSQTQSSSSEESVISKSYTSIPLVQDVLSMGFLRRLVKETIFNKILTTGGENYKETADLVNDLVTAQKEQTEEERDRQSEQKDLPMEEQLRRLQEERTCKICMDQEVSIVFIPCGHLVVCKDCAPSLRKCPICRGIIKGTVRTFLS